MYVDLYIYIYIYIYTQIYASTRKSKDNHMYTDKYKYKSKDKYYKDKYYKHKGAEGAKMESKRVPKWCKIAFPLTINLQVHFTVLIKTSHVQTLGLSKKWVGETPEEVTILTITRAL